MIVWLNRGMAVVQNFEGRGSRSVGEFFNNIFVQTETRVLHKFVYLYDIDRMNLHQSSLRSLCCRARGKLSFFRSYLVKICHVI